MTREKNEASILVLFLFILSMSFAPQYFSIDLRPIIYLYWILYSTFKSGFAHKIILTRYSKVTFMSLLFLAAYSMFVVLITSSYEHYIYIRYYRSIFALITVIYFTSSFKINIEKLINALLGLLFLHALIINIEIIYPSFKDYMVVFSGVSRTFYKFRANGFVNSYDLAGIYTIMGFLISSYKHLQSRKKRYFIMSIFFVVATVFTSRLNILFLLIAYMYIFLKSMKYKVMAYKTLTVIALPILGILGIGLWSITTDTLPIVREYIFDKPWGNGVYSIIRATYSDDSISQLVNKHYIIEINNAIEFIFGHGVEGSFDPGYSKILNSIGFLGLVFIVLYYLMQFKYILRFKIRRNEGSKYILYILISYIFLLILIGNFKILYFFSTSLFELLSILVLTLELNKQKITKRILN